MRLCLYVFLAMFNAICSAALELVVNNYSSNYIKEVQVKVILKNGTTINKKATDLKEMSSYKYTLNDVNHFPFSDILLYLLGK